MSFWLVMMIVIGVLLTHPGFDRLSLTGNLEEVRQLACQAEPVEARMRQQRMN